MSDKVLKLLYLNTALGETGLLPDGAVVNIGGVASENFTIGGKGVVLADGSVTGPAGTASFTLQRAYDNSPNGTILLTETQDFSIKGTTGAGIFVDGGTGETTFDAAVNFADISISGTINGYIQIEKLYEDVSKHLNNDTEPKHTATQISVDNSEMVVLTSPSLQTNLGIIDSFLSAVSSFKSYVFEETNNSTVWEIFHNKDSLNPSVSIFGQDGISVIPDEVVIVDNNHISIVFSSPQNGKAIILFI